MNSMAPNFHRARYTYHRACRSHLIILVTNRNHKALDALVTRYTKDPVFAEDIVTELSAETPRATWKRVCAMHKCTLYTCLQPVFE